MYVWRLWLSMFATTALIIGLSTLAFVLIMSWIGVGWLWGVVFAVVFNIIQWLLAPYFIELLYGIREIRPEDNPWLHRVAEKLSRASGIPKPKIMLADLPIPNAFAYGTPFTGARVAITRGLLRVLEPDEVEAVLGHEFGHIRHRDMQIMMLASLLPAIFYWLGQILLRASQGEREEAGAFTLAGLLSLALYGALTLFVLHLSRLREYYADLHSAYIVPNGPRRLSSALAKIVYASERLVRGLGPGHFAFKSLFITDPECASRDRISLEVWRKGYGDDTLVRRLISRRLTLFDEFIELFSTHPNVVKRLRALQELDRILSSE